MKRLVALFLILGCSASQDATPTSTDCGQEAGTLGKVDGGGLAEAPRGLAELPRAYDAGAGVDTCPDVAPPAERKAELQDGGHDVAPEVSRDTAPGVDGGAMDSEPIDGGNDAQCPHPRTIPVAGNCMICGIVGGPCCFEGAPCDEGFACSNFACVVKR